MKIFKILFSLSFLAFLFACQDDMDFGTNIGKSNNFATFDNAEEVKIAILSDLHVMDQSLLVKDGPAFQEYLAKDPKLLEFSSKILQLTVNKIIMQHPDLVLIPGDLTKDGEIISHEYVARMLRQFSLHGIKVLVTVGNHDVNNPEAVRFIDDKKVPVPTAQVKKILSTYARFGFDNAISRDPNSLSYVNEPIEGLWIVTIDACRYEENTTKCITGGIIKPGTIVWLKERLAEAQSKGYTVIGMMHHGLIEHYAYQEMVDPGYVVENWPSVADTLINNGMKIILTGHYHATDITKRTYNNHFLFDVETGSIVNYPCTYRMLTINGNLFSFRRQTTTDLMGPAFDAQARSFLSNHLDGYFNYVLTQYGVPADSALVFAPWFKDAIMAHLAGDEIPDMTTLPDQMGRLNAVGAWQLALGLGSIWTDINTPDNDVTIDMSTGLVQ